MIALFYDAIKAVLATQFPQLPNGEGVRLIDYDYGQYLPRADGQPDKPNYPKTAIYIGIQPFEVRHLQGKVMRADRFAFSITLVQHTIVDNDARITNTKLNHWQLIQQIYEHIHLRTLTLADVPALNPVVNKPLTSSLILQNIMPENRLSTQQITRLNYVTSLDIYPVTASPEVVVTPDIDPIVEIVHNLTEQQTGIPPYFALV